MPDGSMEGDHEVECSRRTLVIMRDHDALLAEVGGTYSNNDELMAWMPRGAHDHVSSKAPVIELPHITLFYLYDCEIRNE